MRIISYKCSSTETGKAHWNFSKVTFGKTNLLVGGTSSGKTRILNTIFNLGKFAAAGEFKNGIWDLTFETNSRKYHWVIISQIQDSNQVVTTDQLFEITPDGESPIVDRDAHHFAFQGKELPKLPKNQSSISLLADEEVIRPIHLGFSAMRRRNFDLNALEQATAFSVIPPALFDELHQKKDLDTIRKANLTLSTTLALLSQYFPQIYTTICEHYKAVFPFIAEISIIDASKIHPTVSFPGKAPLFCIKEKTVDSWLPIEELSSGMKKVLLILTDLYVLPDGSIYLIDEYENSLGINAIEFLPTLFLTLEKDIQLFVTSHHPYLINRIPVADWYVFHRIGSNVQVKFGEELTSRFGKSKQKAFIQLINDPFYLEGVE